MNLLKELTNNNYSIIASNGYFSFERGIKPVINKLNENINYFKGLIVADKIIGKASAMLLCLSKVKEVYTITLSKAGKEIFEKYGVLYHCDNLVDCIINRKGDDICPMEKVVKDINDLDEAYKLLNDRVIELSITKSSEEDNELVHAKLKEYNKQYYKDLKEYSYHIKNEDGDIIAGIVANSTYETIEVEYLYVDEKYRNKGYGRNLLKYIETKAREDNLKQVLINTYSFQAPEFYILNGYELLFKIDKCFNDYDQYFFIKRIANIY